MPASASARRVALDIGRPVMHQWRIPGKRALASTVA